MSLRNVLNEAQAIDFFDRAANNADLANNAYWRGCFARAHVMCKDFLKLGIEPKKLWIEAESAIDGDIVSFKLGNGRRTKWNYHVLPVADVLRHDGRIDEMVFDTLMFDGPVPFEFYEHNILQDEDADLLKYAIAKYDEGVWGWGNYTPKWSAHERGENHAEKILEELREEQERLFKNLKRKVFPSPFRLEFLAKQQLDNKTITKRSFEGTDWTTIDASTPLMRKRRSLLLGRKI